MSSTLFQLFLPDPLGLLLLLAIEGVPSLLLALFLALFEALLSLLNQTLLKLLQLFLKTKYKNHLHTALRCFGYTLQSIYATVVGFPDFNHQLFRSYFVDEASGCCDFRYEVLLILNHPGHPLFVLKSLLTLHFHVADLIQMCTIIHCEIRVISGLQIFP